MMGVDNGYKNILIESNSKINSRLRRRINNLDYEFETNLKDINKENDVCKFVSEEELFEFVSDDTIKVMYYLYFADLDVNSGDWFKIYHDMVKYLKDKFYYMVKMNYHINCGD